MTRCGSPPADSAWDAAAARTLRTNGCWSKATTPRSRAFAEQAKIYADLLYEVARLGKKGR